MKNEVFNGSRFWNWFKYDTIQLWRNHMFAALGIGLAGVISYIVTVCYNLIVHGEWQAINGDARLMVFFLAFVALELYQTTTYGYLTKKKEGSSWLMAPASGLEKWTSMLINTLIVIPVLFFVVFLGTDWLITLVDHTGGKSLLFSFSGVLSEISNAIRNSEVDFSMGTVVWFFLSSFCVNFLYFLLSGLVFKKHKIIWGIVALMVISSALTFIFSRIGWNVNTEFVAGTHNGIAIMNGFSACMTVAAIALAAGIYYRIKTIKH
ncbi:MAG: hypothetical protein J6W94_06540 [Bacteroidales bacterium]|nr:hypothetical protein [Bacteroidales bacterium]MBP5676650.1 hypothetical protein [Bacteroidales bacterium]